MGQQVLDSFDSGHRQEVNSADYGPWTMVMHLQVLHNAPEFLDWLKNYWLLKDSTAWN
jgi:hypothetical protein